MSIIGISGKKTVGKDTVGKIIEYLTGESTVYPFDLNIDYSHKSNWEVKKFADKLKDIICLLINCTRDELENESFKSKELGEEWWYWYMERDGGYSPIILDYLTTTKKELKNYEGLELIKPTIRFLLQFIGTNLFRNQLHPEIWVTSLFSTYTGDIETWNPIENYEDLYEISNFGRVRSLDRIVVYGENKGSYHTRRGQILKGTLSSGYETVSLSGKTHSIHVLVAKHFVKGYKEGYVVNHIDYNKVNNFYKNLEWVSIKDNILHNKKTLRGAFGEKQRDSKLTNDDVILIRNLMKDGVKQSVIAKNFKVSPTTITDIKKDRKWSHVGKDIPIINPITPKLFPNWLITDMRFPNEMDAVKKRGGITIRVNRPCDICGGSGYHKMSCPVSKSGEHLSETSLDKAEFDYVIENSGSIEELIEKVREILKKEKLI